MISVLIADDHPMVRRCILSVLANEPSIKVVGEAGDFSQAITQAENMTPHVLILDLHMPCNPDLSLREIRSQLRSSGARILGISFANDDDAKSLATTIGAAELLDKTKLGSELIPAIMRLVPPCQCFPIGTDQPRHRRAV